MAIAEYDDQATADTRSRYRELLEELRTILPGVQVLFAFLLTVPFSRRFAELDAFGERLWGVALLGAALATVLFLAPASFHRVAPRQDRADRLRTGVRFTVAGMLVLAVTILSAVLTVMRLVFGSAAAAMAVAGIGSVLVLVWYLVPLVRRISARR